MNLLSMSFSASIIIVVIILLRALLIHKLPKTVFLILWSIVLLRLLIPFSFPSTCSIYFLVSQNSSIMNRIEDTFVMDTSIANFLPFDFSATKENLQIPEDKETEQRTENTISSTKQNSRQETGIGSQVVQEKEDEEQKKIVEKSKEEKEYEENTATPIKGDGYFSVYTVAWMIGVSACIFFFSITYILCFRQFAVSLPVENKVIKEWLVSHKIRRRISIRQSDCISAPLAYGFFHPVILMPKTTKWENSRQLQYILEHEFIHIQRLDAVIKLLFIAAICIHWFNPLVWVMYIFVNRDIELSCDEKVVRRFGEESRTAYARTLIRMEEMKSSPILLVNNFSTDAAEERITAIMRIKKVSAFADILAAIMVISVTAVFATSAAAAGEQGIDSIKEVKAPGRQNAISLCETLLHEDKKELSVADIENSLGFQTAALQEENQLEIFFDKLDIDTETELSLEQQKELLEEYQKYGVYENNGILYYQNRPIRCLVDKYIEETGNGNGGKNFGTVNVYAYFNEKGTVDVSTLREYQEENAEITEVLREPMDMLIDVAPAELCDIVRNIPNESVNKLAQKAANEGRYSDLEKIVPFADTDVVDEIAEQMIEKGVAVDGIIQYLSRDFLREIGRSWL